MQTRKVKRGRQPAGEGQAHFPLQPRGSGRQLSPGQALLLQMGARQGNRAALRFLNQLQVQRQPEEDMAPVGQEQGLAPTAEAPARAGGGQTMTHESYRFADDPAMAQIFAGTKVLKFGSRGMDVRKMQQALVDLGFPLAQYNVDGIFGAETQGALQAFQRSVPVTADGVFGRESILAMQRRFDTRQPYIEQATYDAAHPGTRAITGQEAAAAHEAMLPQAETGKEFKEEVAGVKYGDAVRIALAGQIDALHYEAYRSKAPLRENEQNLFQWDAIETNAAAAKDVTDDLYGSYKVGPEITRENKNIADLWEQEEARDAALKPEEKRAKARSMVNYLLLTRIPEIHALYQAVPSREREAAILDPIKDEFVDTDDKVQKMLEVEQGWTGQLANGVIEIQRFKGKDPEENRVKLWLLFHTFIHEYLHSLTHPRYFAYAQSLDSVRYTTLVEGMTEFFTENVRATLHPDAALRQQVEGEYYNPYAPLTKVDKGVYSHIRQAEEVVGILGVRNVQAAYFQGQLRFIRGWGY